MKTRCENESKTVAVLSDIKIPNNKSANNSAWNIFQGKFDPLIDHLRIAYIEVDQDLKVVEWSGSAQDIWNQGFDEVKGLKLSELVHTVENREWFNDFLNLLLDDPQNTFDIFKHTTNDRKDFYCEWFFSPVYDSDRTASGISMIVRDITINVSMENEIERHRRSGLRRIFKSAPIGVYQADMDGTFVNVNSELAWMLGYESDDALKEELKGMNRGFFADEKQRREFFFYIMEAEQVNQFRAQVIKKDGSKIWTLSHAQITQNSSGRPNGFFGFLIDITPSVRAGEELKQAKEIAESATKAKSDFLANMSHEIRTPLNAIIGFTNLVLKSGLDEKQRDYISKVGIAGRALLNIINDVLDFSKIEAGKLELESTDFSLHDLLNNLSDMFANSVIERKLELIISASPSVPVRLKGDPVRLNQILINLINNSIKFTKKGEVVVWASLMERDGDQVKLQFSVSDTGIGMTPEQRSRLFESFSQADTSTTRKFGGTGLGLSISKRLVELMNGKIWVKSEAGRGSTFAFHVTMNTTESGDERPIDIPERLKGLRILVQDENPAIREVIMMILISYSFRVRVVATGDETIKELERAKRDGAPYEMVIINWQQGMKHQTKTTRFIRAWEILNRESIEPVIMKRALNQSSSIKIPVVITLDFGQEEERQQAEEEGASAFVFKPIKQTQLLNAIMKSYGSPALYLADSLSHDEISDEVKSVIHGAYVLLVDDNEINLEVATETMKQQGIVVDCVEGGRQAVEKVKQKGRGLAEDGSVMHPYDAVLMDLQMPDMDGYQASELIRDWEKNQNESCVIPCTMPIIAMSAHALTSEIEKCHNSGMNDYVAKPIEPKVLFSQLAKWIKPVQRMIPVADEIPSTQHDIDAGKGTQDHGVLSLIGIDVDLGLSKVAGNKELYNRLLNKFFQNNKNTIDDLSKAITRRDFEGVKQIAHTIKGVSGNLGMTGLFESSSDLEKAAKESQIDIVDSRFVRFSEDLQTVPSSIETMAVFLDVVPNALDTATVEKHALDFHQVITCIEQISKSIDDDIAEARSGFSKLKQYLAGTTHFKDLKDIEGAMDVFDSDRAQNGLVTLLNELKKSMKDEHGFVAELKTQKVLVVDDVSENIEVLMELLKADYKVVGALNGEKALELSRGKQAPDIILLDVNMPGISGFEVCRILKENEETRDIPVIFITAETEVAEQAKGFDLGAVDYITKPIVPAIVKMRVKTQLEIKRQNDFLSRLSTIDGLTQIANRRRFDDILLREWHRCMRSNCNLSIVLMDIDHFKQYNDLYGHQAGDDCLRQVAGALLKGCMRETDLVARYGGEEFVAVLPDTDFEGALVVAERMRSMIAFLDIPHAKSSAASYVTLSQGVVTMVPSQTMTIKQFIESSDECLYEAKETGRNRAVAKIILL
ncbi:MAG: response regulator [Desulfobacteraceae bacterium]|jgi:diguanylate cyclase (GGDEF)-like protein/PAS domain S-box-containing protein